MFCTSVCTTSLYRRFFWFADLGCGSFCGWVGTVPPRRTLLCRRYLSFPTSEAEFGRRLRCSRLPVLPGCFFVLGHSSSFLEMTLYFTNTVIGSLELICHCNKSLKYIYIRGKYMEYLIGTSFFGRTYQGFIFGGPVRNVFFG